MEDQEKSLQESKPIEDVLQEVGESVAKKMGKDPLSVNVPYQMARMEKELLEIILSGGTRKGSGRRISKEELWDEVRW